MILSIKRFYKIAFILMFVFALNNLFAQLESQYNYDPFISFDNYYVDKVIYYEKHLYSPFLLKDQVESLHVFNTTTESKTAIKYYFDKDKKNIRVTTYDNDLNEVGDRKFLSKPFYDGYQPVKEGYSIQDLNKILTWSSTIDSINKIIIIETLTNGKLTAFDSVLYFDNYIPLEITSKELRNGNWHNYYFQKFEYDNDKIITTLKMNILYNKHWGVKRFYDEYGKPQYQQAINIDIESLNYTLDTFKREIFKWNGNDFIYNNGNLITSYDSDFNKLTRKSDDATTLIELSASFKPLKIDIEYSNRFSSKIEIIYHYNENGDCIDKEYQNINSSKSNEHFDFIYDEKGNWVERKIYIDEKWYSTTRRKITYY